MDSSGNESQTETNNQEVGALDLKGINLDPSGDELLEAEVMVVPQSEYEFEIQTSDTPSQSFVEDVLD